MGSTRGHDRTRTVVLGRLDEKGVGRGRTSRVVMTSGLFSRRKNPGGSVRPSLDSYLGPR